VFDNRDILIIYDFKRIFLTTDWTDWADLH
jgi:hypothetical protein